MIKGWLGQHDIFKETFPHASQSTIIKNCGPYPFGSAATSVARPPEPDAPIRLKGLRASTRIRQSSKPLLNKLEQEWLAVLKSRHCNASIRSMAKTYRIANGLRYTPDFTAMIADENGNTTETAWEVKGKWADGDSFPKLKMAATVWPEISWVLVWRGDDGQWREQKILA